MKNQIYRTIILPLIHRYENWSLALREEHRMRVFENGVLRKIFGPKREEVGGYWIQFYVEEFGLLEPS
jgi:hypothetical protein